MLWQGTQLAFFGRTALGTPYGRCRGKVTTVAIFGYRRNTTILRQVLCADSVAPEVSIATNARIRLDLLGLFDSFLTSTQIAQK